MRLVSVGIVVLAFLMVFAGVGYGGTVARPDVRVAGVKVVKVGSEARTQWLGHLRPGGGANVIESGRRSLVRYRVTVHNRPRSGDLRNVRVRVSYTRVGTRPLHKLQEVRIIKRLPAGKRKAVKFDFFGAFMFGRVHQLTVAVAPVPGETDLDDNTRSYQMLFQRS